MMIGNQHSLRILHEKIGEDRPMFLWELVCPSRLSVNLPGMAEEMDSQSSIVIGQIGNTPDKNRPLL